MVRTCIYKDIPYIYMKLNLDNRQGSILYIGKGPQPPKLFGENRESEAEKSGRKK